MNAAPNVFDIEGDEEGNPLPAPPPAEEPPAAEVRRTPPRRRGRPPGSKNRSSTLAESVAAAATAPVGSSAPLVPEGEDAPKDPSSLWTRIYEECSRIGASVDDYRICVDRTHLNGLPIQRTPMQPELSGSVVTGDQNLNLTPGEQLVGQIVDVYHRDCAPATYVVRFMSRRTGKTIRQSTPLPLEAYHVIMRKRDTMAEQERVKQFGASSGYQRPLTSPAYMLPPAAASIPGLDPLAKQLLDTVLGQLNETRAELAHLRGQPAPAPVQLPAAAAAPARAVEDPDEAFMKKLKMMREMSALLNPSQAAAPITAETIAAAVRQQIVQMQEAGIIPKAGATAAAAPPPADSIEAILDAKRKENALKVKLRQAFPDEFLSKEDAEAARNVENAPVAAQIVPGSNFLGEPLKWLPFPTGDESGMSWREWLMRMGAENPRRSQEFIGTAMKAVAGNEGLLSKLMDAVKNMTHTNGAVVEAPVAPIGEVPAPSGWTAQT